MKLQPHKVAYYKISPSSLLTFHGSAYSPSAVSLQNDQPNDDRWYSEINQKTALTMSIHKFFIKL